MGTTKLEFISALTENHLVDWCTCEAALANPDPEVKALATGHLRDLAEEGDPFSQALLEGRKIP